MILSATVIGAGALAQSLVPAWVKQGIKINQVIAKHLENSLSLAEQVQAQASDCICEIMPSDIILLCVPDTEIQSIAQEINIYFETEGHTPLLCHTSGATPLQALSPAIRKAVFYPLQTFSKNKTIVWEHIPIFIEASEKKDEDNLVMLATQLSSKVQVLSSYQRQQVHLGAVFVSNFVNVLGSIGAEIAAKNQFPFQYYLPLMQEVVEKLTYLSPKEAQTGPAKRKDAQTIHIHTQLLEEQFPEYVDVYQWMTQWIQEKLS